MKPQAFVRWCTALEIDLQDGIEFLPGQGLTAEASYGQFPEAVWVVGVRGRGEYHNNGSLLLQQGQGLIGIKKLDAGFG